ncbi:peptide-N-glycosidase F-related protein [Pseudoalteromonas sp. McH1-42]|uniref:peptide-N-glycosidase F-related protein n=1 Tax=Pseudoalteromonas sp. McH1-42 TaxID=2917752 RepID=UPI001EF6C62C|nr:peptide-N-glycosidase F-related protein [Pseudoalteromonas sp. McH1-42]MCG7563069.1 hypothetical protein [Pseudoalteromonas sp. McH1-42]
MKIGFICLLLFCTTALAKEQLLTPFTSFTKHGDHTFAVELASQENTGRHLLEIELGCASQGCSDWDYTVRFEWQKDGTSYELGRLITPYAGYMQRAMHGFDRTWRRTYTFDVSHLIPVLQGKGHFNVHYGGWGAKQSAFGISAKLHSDTQFNKQEVLRAIPLYESGSEGWPYKTSEYFDTLLTQRAFQFQANEQHAEIKMFVSSHGHALSFDNPRGEPELCGEWCDRFFTIKHNNDTIVKQQLWRKDCDMSATFPQGGTYIFARSNWCPGESVIPFSYDIDTTQTNNTIDLDWQRYSWQPSQYGNTAPRYIVNAVLVTYANKPATTDIALTRIVSPNAQTPERFGIQCGAIEAEIKNMGSADIHAVRFHYGIAGRQQYFYDWQGNLKPGDTKIVRIPTRYLGQFDTQTARIKVSAEVSGDENMANNDANALMHMPLSLFNTPKLNILTGKIPDETKVELRDRHQNIIQSWHTFNAQQWHELVLEQPAGCYELVVYDSARDGLAFPFFNNRKGQGALNLSYDLDEKTVTHELQPDFGRKLSIPFTLGYKFGGCAAQEWQNDKAYRQGDAPVAYNGIIYRARHWSYGFQPDRSGQYDAWQPVSYCDGSPLNESLNNTTSMQHTKAIE